MRTYPAFCRWPAITFAALCLILPRWVEAQVQDDPISLPVDFEAAFQSDPTSDTNNPAYLTVTPDGVATATGSNTSGGWANTSAAFARLKPGKNYVVTLSTHLLRKAQVHIHPPFGYRVFIDDVEHQRF